jgi:two-component system LytT family response regulator
MHSRIKIAVVDDDLHIHDDLKEYYIDSPTVEIKYNFRSSNEFIKTLYTLDFDLCILDINMPGLNGISVAQLIGKKPVIFLTASEDKLAEALGLNPIDVVTKPFLKKRLDQALEKAARLILSQVEYALFNVAECRKKVKIQLADILFVNVDEVDPRNKQVILKGGIRFTFMDYTFNELKVRAPQLIQVNRSNMVAIDCINSVGHDSVVLNTEICKELPAEVTLSTTFKEELSKKIFFK